MQKNNLTRKQRVITVSYTHLPILTVPLFEVLLVHVLLYIGFIGAYLLGYADSDCFIVQQFTDRRIEFVQFQSGIDIFLAPSETGGQ